MPPFALPKGPFGFGAPVLPKPAPPPKPTARPRPAPPPRPVARPSPPPSARGVTGTAYAPSRPVARPSARGVTGTAYAPSRAPARPVSGRTIVRQAAPAYPVPPAVKQRVDTLRAVQTSLARTRAKAPAVAAAYARTHPNDTLENLLQKAGAYAAKPITAFGKDIIRGFSGQNYDAKGRPIGGGGPSGVLPGAAITPLASASAETAKIGTNLAKGAVNLPASVIPSAYDMGKAGVQAIQGHPKALLGQLKAVPQAFTPKQLEQNPLNAALIASGVASGVGTALGAAGDLAGVTSAAARAREPMQLAANLHEPVEPLARDLYRQAIQRGVAKTKKKITPPETWVTGIGHRVRRIAAENVDAGETLRRSNRNAVNRLTNDLVTKGRSLGQLKRHMRDPLEPAFAQKVHGVDAINYLGQLGITRKEQIVPALEKKIRSLEAQPRETDPKLAEVRQNTIDHLRSLLTNNAFLNDAAGALRAARELAHYQITNHRGETGPMVHWGLHSAEADSAAPLVPYALDEMGLNRGARPTPAMEQYNRYLEAEKRADQARKHLAGVGGNRVDPKEVDQVRRQLETRRQAERDLRPNEADHQRYTTAATAQRQAERHLMGVAGGDPKVVEQARLRLTQRERELRDTQAGEDRYQAAARKHQAAVEKVMETETRLRKLFGTGDQRVIEAAHRQVQLRETEAALLKTKEPAQHLQQHEVFYDPATLRTVPDQEIRDHMKANGRAEPLFVSHMPDVGDVASSAYVKQSQHPLANAQFRSGDAWRRGLVDLSYEAVRNQLRRNQGKIDAATTAQHHMDQAGIFNTDPETGGPEGYWKTAREAKAAVDSPGVKRQNPHNLDLVPVNVYQLFTREGQIKAIKGDLTPLHEAAPEQPMTDAAKTTQQAGRWILMPRDYAETVAAYEKRAGSLIRTGRTITRNYRRANIATSVHRIVGLPMENTIRALPSGTTPRDYYRWAAFRDLASKPEFNTPEFKAKYGQTAEQWVRGAEARAMAGQLAGQSLRESIYDPRSPLARARGKMVIGHVMKYWGNGTDAIMHAEARGFEHSFQQALAGRFLRQVAKDTGISFGQALKLQGDAAEEMFKGLIGGRKEVELARYVDKYAGRYGKLSPQARNTILMTPFGMWFVNSLKFVYATMPTDHPIITGLLAAANTATQKERTKQGLLGPVGNDWNPFELEMGQQGGIPWGRSGIWPASYYSPTGASADPLGSILSLSAPQALPAVLALAGDNWYGAKMTVPGLARGAEIPFGARMNVAISSLLGNFLPVAKIQQLVTGGTSNYSSSVPWDIHRYTDSAKPNYGGALSHLVSPIAVQKTRLASGSHGGSTAPSGRPPGFYVPGRSSGAAPPGYNVPGRRGSGGPPGYNVP